MQQAYLDEDDLIEAYLNWSDANPNYDPQQRAFVEDLQEYLLHVEDIEEDQFAALNYIIGSNAIDVVRWLPL
jgi:hypothetical protein